MTLIFPENDAQNEAIAQWVMKKIGRKAVKPYRAIGLIERHAGDFRLVAGVVFNGYNGANVDLTAYAPARLTRANMRAIFRFAFVDLEATRITARTRLQLRSIIGGERLHAQPGLLIRMGFKLECKAPGWYGKPPLGDAMVYRMMRGECPWLGVDDGRRTRGTRPKGNGRSASADEPRDGRHANGLERPEPVHADRLA